MPGVLFTAAIAAIIFHKRIPKLRNFTSTKARVLFGLLWLSTPFIPAFYYAFNEDK